MPTIVHVDPDMPAERMVRIFNQQVSQDGTLTEALKSKVHVTNSQKRHSKDREIEYRKKRGSDQK